MQTGGNPASPGRSHLRHFTPEVVSMDANSGDRCDGAEGLRNVTRHRADSVLPRLQRYARLREQA